MERVGDALAAEDGAAAAAAKTQRRLHRSGQADGIVGNDLPEGATVSSTAARPAGSAKQHGLVDRIRHAATPSPVRHWSPAPAGLRAPRAPPPACGRGRRRRRARGRSCSPPAGRSAARRVRACAECRRRRPHRSRTSTSPPDRARTWRRDCRRRIRKMMSSRPGIRAPARRPRRCSASGPRGSRCAGRRPPPPRRPAPDRSGRSGGYARRPPW